MPEEDEDILDLINRVNSDMASCSLCDRIMSLEFGELESHMTRIHHLPMHRYLKLFYSTIEKDMRKKSAKKSVSPMHHAVKEEIIVISDTDEW